MNVHIRIESLFQWSALPYDANGSIYDAILWVLPTGASIAGVSYPTELAEIVESDEVFRLGCDVGDAVELEVAFIVSVDVLVDATEWLDRQIALYLAYERD